MAEESNIGASRLLGTNGLQGAVDSFSAEVKQVTAGLKSVVGSITQLIGSNNRMSGSASMSGYMWNANSNRNNYSANGGGPVFTNTGRMGGGRANNGGGGRFGNMGSGSRLSAGVGAALAVGAGLTNYANKNMSDMMIQNYFGNQAAMSVSGAYSQAYVNNATRGAIANYGALSAADAYQAAQITQYASGQAMLNNNGGVSGGFNAAYGQVKSLAYANPTMGATAAANAYAQMQTGRSQIMATAFLGVGPHASVNQLAQAMLSKTLRPGMKYTPQNLPIALSPTGGLGVSLNNLSQQFGWSSATQGEFQQYLTEMVKAQSAGISYTKFGQLMQQAGNGGASGAAARNTLKKAGIGMTAFEAQRNLNMTNAMRGEDINESMATAFTNATNVVNKFSEALTSMMKSTGLDKVLGTAAGATAPFGNALGGISNGLSTGASLYTAYKMFRGAGGAAGAARTAGMGARFSGLFSKFGGSSAGSMAADSGGMMTATADAEGVFTVTSLGAAGGAGGGGALAAAGPYGVAAAGAALVGTMGWKHAVAQEANNEPWWQKGISNVLQMNPVTGFGFAEAGMARRAWDKWVTGKNQESFWSLFNPFGQEKRAPIKKKWKWLHPQGFNPLMPGTGQQGGATSGTSGGGNTQGNGAANMGASAASVIHFAETQLNVPYGWGQENPGHAFDCSGLMQWAYGQAGVKIPRVAIDQRNASKRVNVNQTQPGDLLFMGQDAHHVVMNIGGGKIIEAPHTGANVRIRALNPSEYSSAGRFVNVIGNLGGATGQQTPTTLGNMPGPGGDIGSYTGTSELAAIMSGLATSMGGTMPLTSNANGNAANTGATSGANPTGNGLSDKGSLQTYAKQLLAKYGWSGEWNAFNALVMSESGWDVHATNPSSGAYGIAQALPASKYSSAGSDWKTNGDTQLAWMMDYIRGRYGDPNKAWAFHQKNNWYAAGAWEIDKDQKAVVHAGEMIIPAKQAETIRQVLLNNQFAPNANRGGSTATVSIGQINVQLPQGYTGTASEAQTTGKMIVDAMGEELRVRRIQIGV